MSLREVRRWLQTYIETNGRKKRDKNINARNPGHVTISMYIKTSCSGNFAGRATENHGRREDESDERRGGNAPKG